MEGFKIEVPEHKKQKTLFEFKLDNDLIQWIRTVSFENSVTLTETMHQIVRFAKNNYRREG